jgi:hypothetical protein
MPPCRCANHSNTGFVGIRLWPGGHFVAEISAAGVRVCGSAPSTVRRSLPAHTMLRRGGLPGHATT